MKENEAFPFCLRHIAALLCCTVLAFGSSVFPSVGLSPSCHAQAAASAPLEAIATESGTDEEDSEDPISPEELAESDEDPRKITGDDALDVHGKLDAVLKSYATMGASIAVIVNGEIVFTHVYGTRQKNGDPVTEDTAFQVGSISKMVTGIGLMQLVEQGEATLDTDLGDILGFPVRNPSHPQAPVTLRQLMTHTASLRDSGSYNSAILGRGKPLSEVFSGHLQAYAFHSHKPGTQVKYSNFGGGLAGSIIEALSGQTVDDYMKEHVFTPLSITAGYQAAFLPADLPLADMYAMPSRRATKILREDPTRLTTPDPQMHYYLTAGKLIISAPDLCKLLIALCDGGAYGDVRIIKESSASEICTPQNARGSVTTNSNRGLYVNIIENDQVEGRVMYGHGGKAYGMLCAAYFDPTDRTGVVMLTNGCNNRKTYNGVGMLGRAVMRLCYDEVIDPGYEGENPFLVQE